jgi:hypothetical protein
MGARVEGVGYESSEIGRSGKSNYGNRGAAMLSFEPVHVNDCTLAPTPSMARTMRFKALGIPRGRQPVGTTVDVSCGNPLCYAAKHVVLRRWKSFGGKWQPWATKLAGLPIGGSFDLPDYPRDTPSRNRLRGGVSACAAGRMLKFSTRSLPTGGIRVTRTGTWGEADTKGRESPR